MIRHHTRMKYILAPILLLVFLFPTLALGEEVTFDDLVEANGVYYKKFTDVPFTGKTTGEIQGSFKNGKKDGPWVWYHSNGQLFEKGTYKDGQLEGPWVRYYQSGQLDYKGTYKDGNRDGPWVSYKNDGTVDEKFTGTFKDGVKISD